MRTCSNVEDAVETMMENNIRNEPTSPQAASFGESEFSGSRAALITYSLLYVVLNEGFTSWKYLFGLYALSASYSLALESQHNAVRSVWIRDVYLSQVKQPLMSPCLQACLTSVPLFSSRHVCNPVEPFAMDSSWSMFTYV